MSVPARPHSRSCWRGYLARSGCGSLLTNHQTQDRLLFALTVTDSAPPEPGRLSPPTRHLLGAAVTVGSSTEGGSDGATSVLQALQQQLRSTALAGGVGEEANSGAASGPGRALQALVQRQQHTGGAEAAGSGVRAQVPTRKLQATATQPKVAATAAVAAAAGSTKRRPPPPRPRPRPLPAPTKCPDLPANSLDAAEAVLSANFGVLYSDLLWGIKKFNLQGAPGRQRLACLGRRWQHMTASAAPCSARYVRQASAMDAWCSVPLAHAAVPAAARLQMQPSAGCFVSAACCGWPAGGQPGSQQLGRAVPASSEDTRQHAAVAAVCPMQMTCGVRPAAGCWCSL